jgi:high affinity sulfate transporter 1
MTKGSKDERAGREPGGRRAARRLEQALPIVGWARRYRRADLRPDLLAGSTLAAFAIPESMAYASLAGLEPQVGLYAGIAAMLTYAVFGSSRQLGLGVTSALAIMTAGTVGSLAGGDAARAAAMAAFATLIAGGAAIVGRLFRLGFLANLVSRSVLTGFSAGAGLFIASTQLPKLCGVEAGEGEFFAQITAFAKSAGDTDGVTLGVGAAAAALLLLGKRFTPRLPNPLIVVALALVASTLLHLEGHGVAVVGAIPRGLPSPALPAAALSAWTTLVPLGFSLFVLSYVEGVSAARSLAAAHDGRVDPDQEMLACGAGNVVAGLFQGMPVGGSLTRSSVSVAAGARTQLAGAVGGALLLVVVAFFTGLFRSLPEPVLAAIVLVAVVELIDVRALARIFARSKRELAIAVLTGVGVLSFGMLWGIAIGVVLSLLDLLERTTFPHIAELGRVPKSRTYADRSHHPEYLPAEGTLIVRIDASLVFANTHTVQEDLVERLRRHAAPVERLVLDLEASPLMDLSGADMLDALGAALEAEGIAMEIAGTNASLRRLLRATDSGRFAGLEPASVAQVVDGGRG